MLVHVPRINRINPFFIIKKKIKIEINYDVSNNITQIFAKKKFTRSSYVTVSCLPGGYGESKSQEPAVEWLVAYQQPMSL